MLTLKDCLEFCGLTEEEIEAISEHEHVPEIVAAELGQALLKSGRGVAEIKRFILEDIEHARATGQLAKAARLEEVYRHFDAAHPTPARG
ncbi:MAG: hypothetical protein FJY54_00070 [Betaproteobacteria bacterium]|nr:hypothetical protein [Betaproteobacteria bacterium]